jgi:hypothetical protein
VKACIPEWPKKIWSFLDQLSRHVIEPTVIEISQIKNNLSVRMEEAKKTKFAKCVMDKAEKKLQEDSTQFFFNYYSFN